jgi:branched-chain amino acid transport system permease protein
VATLELPRRMTRGASLWAPLSIIGLVLAAILVPRLPSYYVGLVTQVLLFALLAMSLDLLMGYVGLVSLGHSVFWGTAAYAAALTARHLTSAFWLDVVVALAVTVLLAAVFGLVALRTRGPYFLMITMALGQLPWALAIRWRSLTGGDDGLPGIVRPEVPLLTASLGETESFYVLVLAVVLVCGVALYLLVHSSFGLALRGIRESESRMRALGYNVWLYQYLAFIVAAFFAGIAGVLYAYYNRFVSPVELSVQRSAEAMIMVILGSAGTLLGPALGAGILVGLRGIVGTQTERWFMVLGLIYIAVVLFAPDGLLVRARHLARRRPRA